MTPNIILILGSGPRVGLSVAQKFKAGGYNVAIASRSPDISASTISGFLPITVDLTSIPSIQGAFAQVTSEIGIPSIVVYNGKLLHLPSSPKLI